MHRTTRATALTRALVQAPDRAWRGLRDRISARTGGAGDGERGDVPGWVLVTLMTAGLVIAIWALAGPALEDVFDQAMDRVTGFDG